MYNQTNSKRRNVILGLIAVLFVLGFLILNQPAHAALYNPHPTPTGNSVTSAMLVNSSVVPSKISTADTYTFANILVGLFTAATGVFTTNFTAPASTTFNGVQFKWPVVQGATNTTLTNDGSGNLSWSLASSNSLNTPMVVGVTVNVPSQPVAVMATSSLHYSISYDGSYSTGFLSVTAPTFLLKATTTSSSNSLMLVGVQSAYTLSGVTLTDNGNAMTLEYATTTPSGTTVAFQSVYYEKGASVGAHNIVVTFPTTATQIFDVSEINYTGVNQTTPFGNIYSSPTGVQSIQNNTENGWIVTFTGEKGSTLTGTTYFVVKSVTNIFQSFGVGDSNIPLGVGLYSFRIPIGVSAYTPAVSLIIQPYSTPFVGIQTATSLTQTDVNGYMGFVTATTPAGNNTQVYFCGKLSGFTGLISGTQYYLQDTGGTIATTPGTINKPVGNAIDSSTLRVYCN